MKLAFLSLLSCALWAAAPAPVDNKKCSVSGPTCTTPAMNNTGATVLNAYVSCLGQVSPASPVVSDSLSNTWVLEDFQASTGANVASGSLYRVIGPTVSASQTVTVSSVGSACTLFAASFSGTKTTGPTDKTNGVTSGAALTQTTTQPSITTTASGELLFMGMATYCITGCGTPSVSFNSGFNLLDSTNANSVADGGIGWLVQGAAGSISPTGSAGNVSAGIVSSLTSFKVPASTSTVKHHSITQ